MEILLITLLLLVAAAVEELMLLVLLGDMRVEVEQVDLELQHHFQYQLPQVLIQSLLVAVVLQGQVLLVEMAVIPFLVL
jgi:hypothetical protein